MTAAKVSECLEQEGSWRNTTYACFTEGEQHPLLLSLTFILTHHARKV